MPACSLPRRRAVPNLSRTCNQNTTVNITSFQDKIPFATFQNSKFKAFSLIFIAREYCVPLLSPNGESRKAGSYFLRSVGFPCWLHDTRVFLDAYLLLFTSIYCGWLRLSATLLPILCRGWFRFESSWRLVLLECRQSFPAHFLIFRLSHLIVSSSLLLVWLALLVISVRWFSSFPPWRRFWN